jgi:hypothetical protein
LGYTDPARGAYRQVVKLARRAALVPNIRIAIADLFALR